MKLLVPILFFLFAAPAAAQLKLGNSDTELLEPEKAFRFSARPLAGAVEVKFVIADGYYMYRDKFRFTASGARLGAAELPAGERKKDQFFGEVETYRKNVTIRVPAEGARSFELKVISQGCADAGVCYVPMESQARITLAAAATGAGAGASGGLPRLSLDATDVEVARLFEGNFVIVIASFLAFGLLLAFTPCVLPMIPILSGIIAGEGANIGKARAATLSVSYVLGMAIAYAIAGVAAAYSGSLIAAALQNAWVLGTFAAIFVVLAASMFGLFELRLPGFIENKMVAAQQKLPGGRIASVGAMGVLSAVIVSPCVAAPLAGALLYLSQTRDVLLGGTALFAMAIGMGVPLIVVGVSEGALLPKSGPWLVRVRQVFGVLLLAVAAWIVSPLFLDGKGDTPFARVDSVKQLDEKLRAPGKLVMLDFYADWCVSCKEMESFTFSDPRVRARLDQMLLLQVDVTANSAEHKALLKRYSLFGPPGIIFFDAQGAELKGLRVIGYQNADRFLKTLDLASAP